MLNKELEKAEDAKPVAVQLQLEAKCENVFLRVGFCVYSSWTERDFHFRSLTIKGTIIPYFSHGYLLKSVSWGDTVELQQTSIVSS